MKDVYRLYTKGSSEHELKQKILLEKNSTG